MPSRRSFVRALLSASLVAPLVAMPVRIGVKARQLHLSPQDASAKDGKDKGGGNGNGNGGGDGNGNGKGGGKDKGGARKPDDDGSAPDVDDDSAAQLNPATGDQVRVRGNSIDVLHRNGMRERVKAGRYLMKDAEGRTIIERRATGADLARLRAMRGLTASPDPADLSQPWSHRAMRQPLPSGLQRAAWP